MSLARLLDQTPAAHPPAGILSADWGGEGRQGAFWETGARQSARRVRCESVRSLAQIERFSVWRGRSGQRYTTSIYPVEDCPDYEHVVALAVSQDRKGTRRIVRAFDFGAFPMAALGGSEMAFARAAGACEVHLHLLAPDAEARKAVIADLG